MICKFIPEDKKSQNGLYFCFFGFLVSAIAFFPGFMSPDSLYQYDTTKSWILTDWHPPIMSFIWSILNVGFKGPEGLLYFHLAMLWIGLYFWYKKYKEKQFSWIILGIGFLPWIINFSGVLWKDVGMAFSLLLMTSLIVTKPTKSKTMVAFALLFYAVNVRHNAFFSVIPLILVFLKQLYKNLSWPTISCLSTIILVLIITAGNFLNYQIMHASRSYPANAMMFDDLAYLSLKSKTSFIPGISLQYINNYVRNCASQEVGNERHIGGISCMERRDGYPKINPEHPSLSKIWIKQIINAPIDYFVLRFSAFSDLI